MKRLNELRGQGQSIRQIARELRISRNSVRKYPGLRRSRFYGHRRFPLRGRGDVVGPSWTRSSITLMGGSLMDWIDAWCCFGS